MKALFTKTIFPKLKKIDNVILVVLAAAAAAAAVAVEVAVVALSNLYFRELWFTHRLTCGAVGIVVTFSGPHKNKTVFNLVKIKKCYYF